MQKMENVLFIYGDDLMNICVQWKTYGILFVW